LERRIKVQKETLGEIYRELSERGYTLDEISEHIDSNFRNALYGGSSLTSDAFEKLEDIYRKKIPHNKGFYVDGSGFKQKIKAEKNPELAELVGLILGDGHIAKESFSNEERYVSNHYLDLCFGREEKAVIERSKNLLTNVLGGFNERYIKNNAVSLRVHGVEVVEFLENLGLEPGNKTENQISVPEWIFKDEELAKSCLKGLIDSDGSIYTRESGNTIVYFRNYSRPLLEDFSKLCAFVDIKTSSAGETGVQVSSRQNVEKFVDQVNPIKSKNF